MLEVSAGLMLSALLAGLLTFLAPCTLPLVPAYLALISGVSLDELKHTEHAHARRLILAHSLLFVFGFSAVFIFFGAFAGLIGVPLAPFKQTLTIVSGSLVILFGLSMLGVMRISSFFAKSSLVVPKSIARGKLISSLLLGAAFAVGWTPCVGPILASILLVASTESSVISGALLLAIFSVGLALPFLLLSLCVGSATAHIGSFFAAIHTHRVLLLALTGALIGFALPIVLIGIGTQLPFLSVLSTFGTFFAREALLLFPLIVAGALGSFAWQKKELDVLGVIGGLFLLTLGLLLVTDTFLLFMQHIFSLLSFTGYEAWLMQYL